MTHQTPRVDRSQTKNRCSILSVDTIVDVRHCLEELSESNYGFEDGCGEYTTSYIGEMVTGELCVCSDKDNCNAAVAAAPSTCIVGLLMLTSLFY